MEIPHLQMPPYLELKALQKDREYYIPVFFTPVDTYGRLVLHENHSNDVVFEVVIGGYRALSGLSKRLRFTQRNYQQLCRYADKVYRDFFTSLLRVPTWRVYYD